jgi:hypothetical protein
VESLLAEWKIPFTGSCKIGFFIKQQGNTEKPIPFNISVPHRISTKNMKNFIIYMEYSNYLTKFS